MCLFCLKKNKVVQSSKVPGIAVTPGICMYQRESVQNSEPINKRLFTEEDEEIKKDNELGRFTTKIDIRKKITVNSGGRIPAPKNQPKASNSSNMSQNNGFTIKNDQRKTERLQKENLKIKSDRSRNAENDAVNKKSVTRKNIKDSHPSPRMSIFKNREDPGNKPFFF